MEIKQYDDGKKGMFYIGEQGQQDAEMTYVWVDKDKFIIDHTEVNSSLEGKGAGKQMLAKAVEFARGNNLKIIPLCPFAKSVFSKVSEYQDVLKK